MNKFFAVFFVLFFFSFSQFCFSESFSDKKEEFVVTKKKKKSGKKTKEKACRVSGSYIKTCSELIEKLAQVQAVAIDQTANYLEGADPFAKWSKQELQERIKKLEELENQMVVVCQNCDQILGLC